MTVTWQICKSFLPSSLPHERAAPQLARCGAPAPQSAAPPPPAVPAAPPGPGTETPALAAAAPAPPPGGPGLQRARACARRTPPAPLPAILLQISCVHRMSHRVVLYLRRGCKQGESRCIKIRCRQEDTLAWSSVAFCTRSFSALLQCTARQNQLIRASQHKVIEKECMIGSGTSSAGGAHPEQQSRSCPQQTRRLAAARASA